MKVAIYIEQGVTQLVLTPTTDWERAVTDKLVPSGDSTVRVRRGEFYECQGGWFRHGAFPHANEKSLILRIDEPVRPPSIGNPGGADLLAEDGC